jgi:Glycine zipper 2TM domain
MRGQALFAASAFALMAIAQPAQAQQYRTYHDEHVAVQQQCSQSRQNRTVGGAIIGGLAGALLGREVADRGVRGEGAALGAVVGAAAGAGIGRSTARCGQVQGSYDPYYGQNQYPNQGYYGNDGYSNGGYRESEYRGGDNYYRGECRPGEVITEDRWGREIREEVTLCRGPDGRWRPE